MGDIVKSEVIVIGSSSIIDIPLVPKGPRSGEVIAPIVTGKFSIALCITSGGATKAGSGVTGSASSIAGVVALGFSCQPVFMSYLKFPDCMAVAASGYPASCHQALPGTPPVVVAGIFLMVPGSIVGRFERSMPKELGLGIPSLSKTKFLKLLRSGIILCPFSFCPNFHRGYIFLRS